VAVAPIGLHKVRRPFDADGVRMIPGSIVDVTEWRNAFQLVDRGYLVAAPDAVVEAAKPAKKAAAKKPATKRAARPTPASAVED
jgi:hypothetical protein